MDVLHSLNHKEPVPKIWEMLDPPTQIIIQILTCLLGICMATRSTRWTVPIETHPMVLVDPHIEAIKVKIIQVFLTEITGMSSRGVPSHRQGLTKDSTRGAHHLPTPYTISQ